MIEPTSPLDKRFHLAISKLMKANNDICALGQLMTQYETNCLTVITKWKDYVSGVFNDLNELDPIGKITIDPLYGKLSQQIFIPFIDYSEAIHVLTNCVTNDPSSIPVRFVEMWFSGGNDFATFMIANYPFAPTPPSSNTNPTPSKSRGTFINKGDGIVFFNMLADALRGNPNVKTDVEWSTRKLFEQDTACGWTSKIYSLGKMKSEPDFPNACTCPLPSPAPTCPLSYFHPAILKVIKANNEICALGPIITYLEENCASGMDNWETFVEEVFQDPEEHDPIGEILRFQSIDSCLAEKLSSQIILPFVDLVEAIHDLELSINLDSSSIPTSFQTMWSKGGSKFATLIQKTYPLVPNSDPSKPRGSFKSTEDGKLFYDSLTSALREHTTDKTKPEWSTSPIYKHKTACEWLSNIYVSGKKPSDPSYPQACTCLLPSPTPSCPAPPSNNPGKAHPSGPLDNSFHQALDMYMEANKAICLLGTTNGYYILNCGGFYLGWYKFISSVFANNHYVDPIGEVTSDPKYGTFSKQLLLPFIDLVIAGTMLRDSIINDPTYPSGEFMTLWLGLGGSFNRLILDLFPFSPSLNPSGSKGVFNSGTAATTFLTNAFSNILPTNPNLGNLHGQISWVSDLLVGDKNSCDWINTLYALGNGNNGPISPASCNCTMSNGLKPTSCPPSSDQIDNNTVEYPDLPENS